jgi:hypothetical protein
MTAVNKNAALVTLRNLSDVNAANTDAHARLTKLIESFTGRSYFTGDAAVAIIDDNTLTVSAEVKPGADYKRAEKALKDAFFKG